MIASRPQTQEKFTVEILEEIKNRLNPAGIDVIVNAIYTCVIDRGANKAEFTTNTMYGRFKDNSQTRNEFLSCL